MGLLKDFIEFLKIKHNQAFLTSNLYYGTLNHADVYSRGDYISAEIKSDKLVIVQKAEKRELNRYLKKKYGSYCGELETYKMPEFAKPQNTEYYKLITADGGFVPATTGKILCSTYRNTGHFDVITNVRHLSSVYKSGMGIRFGDTISLDDIKELENILNLNASKNADKCM